MPVPARYRRPTSTLPPDVRRRAARLLTHIAGRERTRVLSVAAPSVAPEALLELEPFSPAVFWAPAGGIW